jgi:hypothetical protein
VRQVLRHVTLDDRHRDEDEGDAGDGGERLLVAAKHDVPSLGYPLIKALVMQDLGLLLLGMVAG